jgi:hypothetical protein
LKESGMSSDEEDFAVIDDEPVQFFNVKECIWRAKPIRGYMDTIDTAAAELRKISPGGAPRARRRYLKEAGRTKAPEGLPEKMYDESWLADLTQARPLYVEKVLRVSDKPFELLVEGKTKGKGRAYEYE